MALRDIPISTTYSTDSGLNLVKTFYNPILQEASSYDRITGFFSPKVFAIAARGFRACALNDCKIRIITSVVVNNETYEAINEASRVSDISECIDNYNPDSLLDDLDYDYLRLFTELYKSGHLELKVAAVSDGNGIMHEKIGIVSDRYGDAISFSGSNNETASGWLSNVEEFKVFKNWEPIQSSYFESDREKFQSMWNGESKRLKIMSLSEAEASNIIQKVPNNDYTIEQIIEEIEKKENSDGPQGPVKKPQTRELRQYQKDAIEHWFSNDCISVFEMATGTGKTFTAISALKSFEEKNGSIHCFIFVPLISLLSQWKNELVSAFGPDVNIIVASSAISNQWRQELNKLTSRLRLGRSRNFIVLALYNSIIKESFIDSIRELSTPDLILLADEMHNLVTENCMNSLLSSNLFKYRLGLSATPVRLWKPDESQQIIKYFGGNSYVFPLKRAIKEGFLVPFDYHVIQVCLTNDEFDEYMTLSSQIGRYTAISDGDDNEASLALKLKRARIKKNAYDKKSELSKIVTELKRKGQFHHALVYADNKSYLDDIQSVLDAVNVPTSRYTGDETIEIRESIVDALRNRDIDAIVAIKCLDEGVDIPSARNAFFVSSNTDPREYVQRLGRVLRLDKASNKEYATIYDFIVTPPAGFLYEDDSARNIGRNLVRNEAIRANFFCELCRNTEDARSELNGIIDSLNMTFTEDELNINKQKE